MKTAKVQDYRSEEEGVMATVKVGDFVGFKADIEQGGLIIDIRKSGPYRKPTLVLENKDGFVGAYIGGLTVTQELASDCWIG